MILLQDQLKYPSMAISKATTVQAYLAELPQDRRAVIESLRKVIRKNLDRGIEEGIVYGMIGYYIPHRLYPAGYYVDPKIPLLYTCLAAQKNYFSLYLGGTYCGCWTKDVERSPDARWFRKAWTSTGKKLDMGKACVRFKRLEDVPLEVVGEAIARFSTKEYISRYEAAMKERSAVD